MPRITQTEKAHNRQRIVDAASRLFRCRGIDAVGIADLMKAAGLTHGGFYNHFASKDALVTEVCDAAFADSLGLLADLLCQDAEGEPLARVVDDYLSPAHRDAVDGGCPSASLVGGVRIQSDQVQAAYARGVEGYLTGFADQITRDAARNGQDLDPAEARHQAVRLFSELVGAMVLSRAVRRVEPTLSDEFLRLAEYTRTAARA